MQRGLADANSSAYYVRYLRWGERYHPIVKQSALLFLMILIFLFVVGYTGIIPLHLQPPLLYIMVSLLVISAVLFIIGVFKSFDRSGWPFLIVMIILSILLGILSLLSAKR